MFAKFACLLKVTKHPRLPLTVPILDGLSLCRVVPKNVPDFNCKLQKMQSESFDFGRVQTNAIPLLTTMWLAITEWRRPCFLSFTPQTKQEANQRYLMK